MQPVAAVPVSKGAPCTANVAVLTDVSKQRSASIFRVEQMKLTLKKEASSALLSNIGNLSINTAYNHRRLGSLSAQAQISLHSYGSLAIAVDCFEHPSRTRAEQRATLSTVIDTHHYSCDQLQTPAAISFFDFDIGRSEERRHAKWLVAVCRQAGQCDSHRHR
jgi:hypothetical protein